MHFYAYGGLLIKCFTCAFIFQVADYNVAAAQQGIVYIDEVDKITKKVSLTLFFYSVLSPLYIFLKNFFCLFLKLSTSSTFLLCRLRALTLVEMCLGRVFSRHY